MTEPEKRGAGSGSGRGAAVLLLGHGSHLSSDSSRPVHAVARSLRRSGGFPEVRVGFWKEDPHLHHALRTVEHPEVVVVPIFTSTGYFTDRVVPRELGLRGRTGRVHGIRVRYAPPVGTHPRMRELVLERADEAEGPGAETGPPRPGASGSRDETDLVVVGHGTPRHPESGRVVRELVETLRADWPGGRVWSAFLDEPPRVGDVLAELEAPRAVVVPFFIADGWHAGVTLPGGLGVEGGAARVGGTEVRYARPVGTHPALAGIVAEIVEAEASREADAGAPPVRGPPPLAGSAREAFLRWVRAGGRGGRTFLQIRIRATGGDRYELRHVADVGAPEGDLDERADPEEAVEIAARTADGDHRPLKTAPDLRRGWRLRDLGAREVWEACGHLYPAAAVYGHLARAGALPTVSYREAAGRQTGMFARLGELPDEGVVAVARDVCAADRCLRRVRWALAPEGEASGDASWTRLRDALGPDGGPGPEVPCPEPCSVLLTAALEAVDSGSGPPSHPDAADTVEGPG